MNDWAAAAAVLGLSCVNAGNVYYLELRDTYFLRVREKQTNEARHDGLYSEILFASCRPHVRGTLGRTPGTHVAPASCTRHLSLARPPALSLSLGSLLTDTCAHRQTRKSTEARTRPPRTCSHRWNISGNTSNMTQGGSPR